MWFCFVLEGSGSVELRNWDSQGGWWGGSPLRGWDLWWAWLLWFWFGLTRSIWHTAWDSRGTGFVRRSTLWMTWGPFSYSGGWNIQLWGWRRLGGWSIGAWKLRRAKFSFEAAWSNPERLCIIRRSEVRVLEIKLQDICFLCWGKVWGGGTYFNWIIEGVIFHSVVYFFGSLTRAVQAEADQIVCWGSLAEAFQVRKFSGD